MTNLTRRLSALLTVAFLGLVLTACGTDENESASGPQADIECATGSITGAGSTFVQTITQQWIKDYGAACSDATVNYQGVGSGAGITQFTAGTVDFAGSDVPLRPEEKTAAEAKHGRVVQIPWSAGGIAVEYNLPQVQALQLSGPTIAAIFAGQVTRWNDPRIATDNPGVQLPATPIAVVHRSDGSGTTAAFSGYLTSVARDVWSFGAVKDLAWPAGQGARGSDGVTAAVKATPGAIGYAELSYPKSSSLGIARVKNAAGEFVSPEGQGPSRALAEAKVNADLTVEPNYSPTARDAYPISTVTYVIMPAQPADAAKRNLLSSFVKYAIGDGQQAAERLFYAPLPAAVSTPAVAAAEAVAQPA